MKIKVLFLTVISLTLISVFSVFAASSTTPNWDITGTWEGHSGLVGDLKYHFYMDLIQDDGGNVTGTIVYDVGAIGSINGSVMGDMFVFTRTDDVYWATCDDCLISWTPSGSFSFEGEGIDNLGSPYRFVGWKATGSASVLPADVGDCIPGSYPGYTLVDTLYVPAIDSGSSTPVMSSEGLTPGITHLVEASGTYFAGGNGKYDIRADAEYSEDAYQRANGLPWTDLVRNYGGYGEGLLELKVDDQFVEWGDFDPNHVYTLPWLGSGNPMAFQLQIYDIYAQNNTGGLCVAIYEPPLISLDPTEAYNPFDSTHTVTATLDPIVESFNVAFEVTSGPNAGDTGTGITDNNGKATFNYIGDGDIEPGIEVDIIMACADLNSDGDCSKGEPFEIAVKKWFDTSQPKYDFCPGSIAKIKELEIYEEAGVIVASSIEAPVSGGDVGIYFLNTGAGSITFSDPAWSVKGEIIPKYITTTIPLTPTDSTSIFWDKGWGGTFDEDEDFLGCVNFTEVMTSRPGGKATAHLDLSFTRDGIVFTVRVNVHFR